MLCTLCARSHYSCTHTCNVGSTHMSTKRSLLERQSGEHQACQRDTRSHRGRGDGACLLLINRRGSSHWRRRNCHSCHFRECSCTVICRLLLQVSRKGCRLQESVELSGIRCSCCFGCLDVELHLGISTATRDRHDDDIRRCALSRSAGSTELKAFCNCLLESKADLLACLSVLVESRCRDTRQRDCGSDGIDFQATVPAGAGAGAGALPVAEAEA